MIGIICVIVIFVGLLMGLIVERETTKTLTYQLAQTHLLLKKSIEKCNQLEKLAFKKGSK